jgi:hypothetical protein
MFTASFEDEGRIIPMKEMEPCQMAVTIPSGELVMRTASASHFEVMNLSNVRADGFWPCPPKSSMVRLLKKGTVIKLVVS